MLTSVKTCRTCGVTKPLSDFYKHPSMRDGHVTRCKICQRGFSKLWPSYRSKMPEELLKKWRAWTPEMKLEWQRANRDKIKKYAATAKAKKAARWEAYLNGEDY